jgi:Family of unknown function (DUF6074)
MADVIAFPTARRTRLIENTAAAMSRATPAGAEKLLNSTLRRQWDSLVSKGISPDVATKHIDAAERAILSKLVAITCRRGGAA